MRFPQSGPLIKNTPAGCQLRSFRLSRFPHSIIAGMVHGVHTIVAVVHNRQEPDYWRGRLK